jgi:beta-galactosidase
MAKSTAARKTKKSPAQKTEPTRERLFDDGWRFHLGDAPGAENPAFDDARWRRLDLPHDWSIEDLPPASPESYEHCYLPVVQAAWRFKRGDDTNWKDPNLDESDWETVNLPDCWEHHSNYNDDNVFGWYRRRVEIPAAYKGQDVIFLLGKVDDVDEAFVNGVRIGGSGTFPPHYQTAYFVERSYTVSASLLKYDGTDVLAVRVFDGPGSGGIIDAPAMTGDRVRVGPFDTHASPGGKHTGYVLGGVGWYRKPFRLAAADRGKSVSIRFDGVYMDSDVWINGHALGNHPYGYTSFTYDLTPFLNPTGQNVLAVRVRNLGKNSRWYSGSGIYRHVWLTLTDPLHVATYGVFVTTPDVTDKQATVRIATTLQNDRQAAANVQVRATILSSNMAVSAVSAAVAQPPSAVSSSFLPVSSSVPQQQQENSKTQPGAAVPQQRQDTAGTAVEHMGKMPMPQGATVEQTLVVKKPRRWSVDSPILYEAVVEVLENGAVIDRVRVPFGIRTFSFDARLGFQLNGQSLKMKGACIHHDNGPLGAATIDRAEVRRVEIMKANGFNAIRTAHNPPSPAFLDACDRLGVLVMDESFDQWQMQKNPEDYHRFFDDWWQRDTQSMVLRDRNHPSIVIWSIGNEIMEYMQPSGAELSKMQADYVRQLDPTRPVTSAIGGMRDEADPFLAPLDVAGYNYAYPLYVRDHGRHPMRVILGTESWPLFAFDQWMGVLDNAHVAGDFVWTGMDYFGECGIGFHDLDGNINPERWPFHGCDCGDIDVCGFKKPPSYYRDVLWGRSALEMAVHAPLPEGAKEWLNPWGWPDEERSWTWPGSEGKPMQVSIYSTEWEVRLTLNGREIGTKEVSRETKFTATFDVPYEPGELRAEALSAEGKVVARQSLRTAGAPAKLRLTVDRAKIRADRNDLAFVTVEVLDPNGLVVPNAALTVNFRLTGPGELAAVGNGDPKFVGSFQQPHCTPHRGRCLAIVRPKGKTGAIEFRAQVKGLTPAALKIQTT